MAMLILQRNTFYLFLESKHISNIDVVVHTHSDNDHAGGAVAIEQHALAKKATFYTPTLGCERGKRIRWQNLTIYIERILIEGCAYISVIAC